MENYTITKEQVLKLANKAEQGCTSLIESDLKNWFPKAFKTELETGKWYKYKLALFYITNKISNNTNYYNIFGFDVDGNWMTDNATTYFNENYTEATREEVEVALKAETIKRYGKHWENTKIKAHADDLPWIGNGLNKGFFSCGLTLNKIYSKHGVLYSHGNWAQILSQEKTVIPMAKALKIIAKKMKVSPENIEIQY